MRRKFIGYGLLALAASLLTACLSGITIGGSVSGLTGTGLVLNYAGSVYVTPIAGEGGYLDFVNESLSINANGNFTFKNQFPLEAPVYRMGIATQPSGQFCMLNGDHGSSIYPGVVGPAPTASITDISVQCVPGLEFQLLAGHAGHNSSSADGTGAAAGFNSLSSIALDGAGNAYVVDTGSNTIRKITPQGVVTTLSGTAGGFGSVDGTGAAARFATPMGIVVDSAGNAYVADAGNSTIRKITPEGVVTTLAGVAGSFGGADGTGAAARFKDPEAVSLDSAGNVYVADTGNDAIRKITPQGVVTTVYQSAEVHLNGVYLKGIAVDGSGNVYAVDTAKNAILKISPAGGVTILVGNPSPMPDPADAKFASLGGGIAVDGAGNLYVLDSIYFRKISPAGTITTIGQWLGGRYGASGLAVSADKLFITSLSDNYDDLSVATVMWSPKN